MLQDHILIHYGEIALKGKNRNYFESRLVQNIKNQLEAFAPESFENACPHTKTQTIQARNKKIASQLHQNDFGVGVKNIFGGIIIKLNKNGVKNKLKIEDALMHTFGIANFSFSVSVSQDIETLKKVCWDLVSGEKFKTFCIRTQRSNKQFEFTSQQINEEVGGYIYEKFDRKKSVNLKNPDCECFIYIINKLALVSMRKIQGLGGMPVGTGGKAMIMMSGGFDSPVAAWFLLKRGVTTQFAHFHSIPYTSQASIEKVANLISVLKKFGSSGIMYSIPFADVQKEIMTKTPAPLRVILYRRFMIRIAEALAKREKALALVTGDSIGQVASQTLENISAVNETATLPVFRPLIGMDKEEIMQKAKQIGTYDISKLPHDDCCTRLMPKSPETRAKLKAVLEAEKNLDVEKIIQETLSKIEKIIIK
jgi:thiamine biosynthesis protein ThiI